MKTRFLTLSILALLLIATAAFATAPTYVNDPPFDPQRTLLWDFSQSGWETPQTIAGPTWGTGDMAGDSLTHSDTVQWYNTSVWSGRQGMMGNDNSNGQSTVTGSMTIHINNYVNSNPLKRIYMEVEFLQWGTVTVEGDFFAPDGYQRQENREAFVETPLDGGAMRINQLYEIRPNPSFEEFRLNFVAAPGAGFLVDRFAVSTACVPEPSALMALGGGLGMLGLAWRRRRA